MTINDAIDTAMRWIDEATVNGVPVQSSFQADYRERMKYLIDSSVSVVEALFPIHKDVIKPNIFVQPIFGFYDPVVYNGEVFNMSGGQTYSMEIFGNVTVEIDGVSATHNYTEFTRLYGTGTNVTVSADTPFSIRNCAMWNNGFTTVPEYKYWIEQTMPSDFLSLDEIQFSGDGVTWQNFSDYRKIEWNVFAIPSQRVGQFAFHYLHKHTPITGSTLGTTDIDILPRALPLVPLRLAVDATSGVQEMQLCNQYLNSRFAEMYGTLDIPDIGIQQRVETVFRW